MDLHIRPRPARGRRLVPLLAGIALSIALTGCGGSDDTAGEDPAPPRIPPSCPEDDGTGTVTEPALRGELLAMQTADQEELTSATGADGSRERTARLGEIIDEYGWPVVDMVGADGASAAWLVAQHADLDPDFQKRALDLMWQHVEDCQVDPTELAYLHDRVAVADDRPQRFGTQLRCGEDGAVPATPLEDESAVDGFRAAVGLAPLAEYKAEFEAGCTDTPQ
ncbi:hypothetical protein LX16_2096 [Stackebrandtia albiflava]|uniref:Lipoprotein n=1 Tax=Stackebrandtia albiflava TaxID=406432 RepID=A0A562VEY2_9ACTN|nr:DUF6624 domain-containing protein [Stackebrandtia albiflava]TWJ16367.1 hypothetical protein LX16_2096 [Stackebrandtia albiflava]